MSDLSLRFTGKTGQVDGYVEVMLGALVFMGIYKSHTMNKRQRNNGITQIYVDLKLSEPPLGHLGEVDIPDA